MSVPRDDAAHVRERGVLNVPRSHPHDRSIMASSIAEAFAAFGYRVGCGRTIPVTPCAVCDRPSLVTLTREGRIIGACADHLSALHEDDA